MNHQIHIQTSLNNTIITVTDSKGNTKITASAGALGFNNSRKSTTYASQTTAEHVAKQCILLGINNIDVILKGIGFGKESSLRGLQTGATSGLFIHKIEDRTPIPHNGCRLRKKRRL
jgi:small subunit ribosomal protein S11